jgi:uncharacterized membrane protein
MSALSDYFGRLHPLIIHFPIALLLVAALLEVIGFVKPGAISPKIISLIVGIGALGALAAAFTGWIFAEHSRQPSDMRATLFWHRWLGIATAFVALGAWAIARSWGDSQHSGRAWTRRLLVVGTAMLVAVASHLGALLVWGADYFEP